MFTAAGLAHYEGRGGFDQIARNLLLTLVFAKRKGLRPAANYILAPADDQKTWRLADKLRDRLQGRYRDCLKTESLEAVVRRGRSAGVARYDLILSRFTERYLDLGPGERLLAQQRGGSSRAPQATTRVRS